MLLYSPGMRILGGAVALAFTILVAGCEPAPADPPRVHAPRRDDPALVSLMDQGVVRAATEEDVDAWRQAVVRHAPSLRDFRIERLRAEYAYVVLAPLVVPPDMYGGNSRGFIVSAGVPAPEDGGSHNAYYFLADGSCAGVDPACEEIAAAKLPAQAGVRFHCDVDHRTRRSLRPVGNGPARLAEVLCHQPPGSHFSESALLVSPNGNRVARVYYPGTVRVSDPSAQGSWRPWADDLAQGDLLFAGGDSVRWGRSGMMWAALQRRADSGGFASEPVRVARLRGVIAEEIGLRDAPGRLDQVQWIGDGMAIGYYDTNGGGYRPVRSDSSPTLAMIDARRGRVLDRLPLGRIGELVEGARPGPARARLLLGTVLQDGRMRVVIPRQDWIVWTQGETPRVVRNPHETRGFAALTPDGTAVLMTNMIRANGVICEHNPNCPAPTPVEGVWSALYDLESGRARWEMRGRAENFGSADPPAISPDGRYALMQLPPTNEIQALALVSMRDGAVLQRFPIWLKSYGFTRDGRVAWLEYGGLLAFYRLN